MCSVGNRLRLVGSCDGFKRCPVERQAAASRGIDSYTLTTQSTYREWKLLGAISVGLRRLEA